MGAGVRTVLIYLVTVMSCCSLKGNTLGNILVTTVVGCFVCVIAYVIRCNPLTLFRTKSSSGTSQLLRMRRIAFIFKVLVICLLVSSCLGDESIGGE